MKNFLLCISLTFVFSCGNTQGPAHQTAPKHKVAIKKALEGKKVLLVDRDLDELKLYPNKDSAAPYLPLPNPELEFDALNYKLAFSFPKESLLQPSFDAVLNLTFKPLKESLQVLKLESVNLEIKQVRLLNTFEQLPFVQKGETLEIDLGKSYTPIDTLTVQIEYEWGKGKEKDGMYFTSRLFQNEIEAIYSQSEPEDSKYWFPSNPRPNDRATFESSIRVPEPFVGVSNGALLGVENLEGYNTYHWSLQMPMATYLFVVTAGKFSTHREYWESVPVEYYGQPDEMEKLKYSLRNTPNMLRFFSKKLGFKYPYEKYAQTVVPQYPMGGMEHTTATTLTDRTLHGPQEDAQYSSDGLVAHELAHQWFGDLVTCKNWDHLWLNEGFATYLDALYHEYAYDKETYYKKLQHGSDWYFWEESTNPRPIVFSYYQDSIIDTYFDSRSYAKGAWVLHMLRNELGDDLFFKGLRHYLYRHQGRLVETADFKKAMEEASSQDLTFFFDQWLYRPGHPLFEVSWNYDDKNHEVILDVAQNQDTNKPGDVVGTTPFYKGKIGVEIQGQQEIVTLSGQAKQTFKFKFLEKPSYVNWNSELQWLAEVKIKQTLSSWLAQLLLSNDLTARVQAAKTLSEITLENTAEDFKNRTESLHTCIVNDTSILVRTHCIEALGLLIESANKTLNQEYFLSQASNLLEKIKGWALKHPDWEVRQIATATLILLPTEDGLSVLKEVLNNETTIKVLVAAVEALGRLDTQKQPEHLQDVNATRANEIFDLIVSQLGRPSFQDRLKVAALNTLAYLKNPRAFSVAKEMASKRYSVPVRKAAFHLLVVLAKTHPELKQNIHDFLKTIAEKDSSSYIQKLVKDALKELELKPNENEKNQDSLLLSFIDYLLSGGNH